MPVITSDTCSFPASFRVLCDKEFDVSDESRIHAVFDLRNTAVGVTLDWRDSSVRLIFHPAVQVPVSLCEGFARFCFEHDDPMMVDLNLDSKDGEVRTIKHLPARKELVERSIAEYLAFFENTAYPDVLAYIRRRFEEEN